MNMTGYYKIRIMSKGQYFDCWQKIAGNQVVGYVKDGGEEISPVLSDGSTPGLPDPYEGMILDKTLRSAPDDLADPVWLAERKAALAKQTPEQSA
jgi:hypothetical protein